MAEYLVHSDDLTAVADAIREKGGTSELLQFPDGFVSAVDAIETGSSADRLTQMVRGELTEFVDPNITTISQGYLFTHNTKVALVDLPNAEGTSPSYSFYYTTGLKQCKLPKITILGNASFMSSGITQVELPALETISTDAFRSCSSLTRLDLPMLKAINGTNCFNGCISLNSLILRRDAMVTLGNANAFSNSAIASGTGYIYVPADLVSTYQENSAWSTYADQFRAIEDYPDV